MYFRRAATARVQPNQYAKIVVIICTAMDFVFVNWWDLHRKSRARMKICADRPVRFSRRSTAINNKEN
jgi:hypothetical protein